MTPRPCLTLVAACLLSTCLDLFLPRLAAQSFPPSLVPQAEREKIEAASPAQAPARPAKPRRLLIFDRNVGYGGHPSIAHASYAFQTMGRKTGAFETEIAQDPAAFRKESLQRFDAVFFNNNVGNLFEDPELRGNLVEFIFSGGGMLGVHGATVAFTKWPGAIEDWPEFGRMLGARGANHRDSTERAIVKVEDPAHPITRCFDPAGFEVRDELFRYQEVYSRRRDRVLLSIDMAKTGMPQGDPRGACVRADNDYALAWVREYGRGRTFHCTIAHNPSVFWDAKLLQFYLAALQFALGDLPSPTLPSALWTPAAQAQERLGWRVGFSGASGHPSLFATLQAATNLNLGYWMADVRLPVSPKIQKTVLDSLTDSEFQELRFQLDDAAVRMVAWRLPALPSDHAGGLALFQKARSMGVELLVAPIQSSQLPSAAQWCDQSGVQLALTEIQSGKETERRPAQLAKACAALPPWIGVAGSMETWNRIKASPHRAVRALGSRLLVLALDEPMSVSTEDSRITRRALQAIHSQRLKPLLFYEGSGTELGKRRQQVESLAVQLSPTTP